MKVAVSFKGEVEKKKKLATAGKKKCFGKVGCSSIC